MKIFFSAKRLSLIRKKQADVFCPLLPAIIYGIPFLTGVLLIKNSQDYWRAASLTASPFSYANGFAFIAGLISIPFQHGIKPGRFPRQTGDLIDSKRKIYGSSRTTACYCKPVDYLVLSTHLVSNCIFRHFGYKGNLNHTIYRDGLVRNPGVPESGARAYLSGRAAIGSNSCQRENTISLVKIFSRENSIIGQQAMTAHGVYIGSDAEGGVGCGVGIKTRTGPRSMINLCPQTGNHVRIGARSYIGAGAAFTGHLKTPGGSLIPGKAGISGVTEPDRYIRSTSLFKHEQGDLLPPASGKVKTTYGNGPGKEMGKFIRYTVKHQIN